MGNISFATLLAIALILGVSVYFLYELRQICLFIDENHVGVLPARMIRSAIYLVLLLLVILDYYYVHKLIQTL